jgi:membrane-associated phospholipid phosphatase
MRIYLLAALLLLASTNTMAQNADIDLLRNINLHRSKSLDGTMKAIAISGYPVTIAAPVTELIVAFATHDGKLFYDGAQTVVALGANAFITEGLKYSVNRARPHTTYPGIEVYETYSGYSFPSGHASFAFCTATSLSLCYPRWYVVVPSYLWAATVGYSQLHLGAHYPSDVLAGALIGAGTSWLAFKANRLYHRKKYKDLFPDPM